MSDCLPSTFEQEASPALRRRLAWGLAAGFGLDEIARRESVARADLEQVLASPGMIILLWVWKTFFEEHDRGGLQGLLRIGTWALALISRHARERAVGAGIGYAFICAFALRAALRPTLKALSGQIEVVIGHGPERKLRGVRANLVDILCWAIETALTQQAVDQLGIEHLGALDEELRDAVASGRFGNSLADYESGGIVTESVAGGGSDVPSSAAEPELAMLSPARVVHQSGRRDLRHERSRGERCSWPPSVRLGPIGMAA